jgi:hypothetical protein
VLTTTTTQRVRCGGGVVVWMTDPLCSKTRLIYNGVIIHSLEEVNQAIYSFNVASLMTQYQVIQFPIFRGSKSQKWRFMKLAVHV